MERRQGRQMLLNIIGGIILSLLGFFAGLWVTSVERRLLVVEQLKLNDEARRVSINAIKEMDTLILEHLEDIGRKLDRHMEGTKDVSKR